MRPETILQALSETRPALLDEAAEPRMSRRRLRPLYRAVLIAAVLYSLRDVFAFAGYSYEHADRYQAGGSEIAGTVRNLDIGWINGKVRLAYRSGTAVSLSETSDRPISGDMQLRWWLDGDTLRIRYAKAGFRQMMMNTQQKVLEVALPEGVRLGDVTIGATSADVAIPSL